MERKQVWMQNTRSISEHNVVVSYSVFWTPWPARTPRNENGWLSALQRRQWRLVRTVHRRSDQNPAGRVAHKDPRFPATNVCSWRRKMPSGSFQAVCESPSSKHETTGAFYLSIKTNRKPGDNLWFKVQPIGINKINAMMKGILADTILESTNKKCTTTALEIRS